MQLKNKKRTGKDGEELAVEYLERNGYRIVERNYQKRGGEIDIIAKQGGDLVFIEVKGWSTIPEEELEYSINARKKGNIIKTARNYIYENIKDEEVSVRFDIVYIALPENRVMLYPSAFYADG
ncbi:MAG: YraN family protein [Spirochaetia bacterium]